MHVRGLYLLFRFDKYGERNSLGSCILKNRIMQPVTLYAWLVILYGHSKKTYLATGINVYCNCSFHCLQFT